MSMSQDSAQAVDQITRTTQTIVGALIAGITMFLLIVAFLVHGAGFGAAAAPRGQAGAANPPGTADPARGQQAAESIPLLTYIAAGMGAILLPMSFILPGVIATQTLRSGAAPRAGDGSSPPKTSAPASVVPASPAAAFQTSTIIGAAMDEGAAFFAGIVYLIEQNPIALVVALVLLAALVVRFPTRNRVERWIAQQEEKLRRGTTV